MEKLTRPLKHWDDYRNQFINMLVPHARVLDIGTGSGDDAKYFSHAGLDMITMDITFNDKTKENLEEIDKIQMDLAKLGFADGSLDGIWLANTLIFMADETVRNHVLRNCYSLLKSGGRIFLCDNYFPSSDIEEVIGVERHSSRRIKEMMENAGFIIDYEEKGVDIVEKRKIGDSNGFHIVFAEKPF